MTDELLASQIDYYRRRAAEYDVTAYGDVEAARARIGRIVGQLRPTGSVLEIACGTGLWTEALARTADTVTALDAAPEALAIAGDRVRSDTVRFQVADVFDWQASEKFDVVFFSAWLSHVPADRFDGFWRLLAGLLRPSGRVLFVDEPVDVQAKESYLPGLAGVVERQLTDGSRHRIVKNFIDPGQLTRRLRELGWECRIQRDDSEWDWLVGEARRSVPQ